ncbi:MAG: glycosyltransferase family 4 protein [Flavobacterium nitrogenifigens]|uniref:Glycosyltransferase involved in cell wall bisynthesis n=1 Tax=Flavobacterium nitrogenifigens TaxID=1617283 RepID=A0A521EDI3_9FLAO|nr:glycosyltransferase family 4 protein [Flavobacterium nitrogenifigens]KAF2325918.1 glycosyltransferase [Flavobacterium nitrogenifigens]MDQ8013348.1 glycosyltransferase family 4 protein [Flavobacterium nitrogenifigens]SMO81979.1 Glycosyltransferase involved in cell wall bisynthesis [Flavobacterium nitrogenifigens]
MRVLIVNAYDNMGGAARASYRLHQSLLEKGIESRMLVQNKFGDDFTVESYTTCTFQNIWEKCRTIADNFPVKFYKNRTKTLFSPSWIGFNNLVNQINTINADIVHLHWISNAMVKIEDLAKIKAPIIWTLHDNWAFTGGCHIMWECIKFKEECGSCPRLDSRKEMDLSRRIFNRKKKTYSKLSNMVVVGLSKWITNCVKESTLLKNHEVVNIPNPIDTNIFKPLDVKYARSLWNLPINKKLILFGAMSATSDVNKGFKELVGSLDLLNDKNIEFVIFGSSEPKEKQPFKLKTHYLGHLHDDVSLVSLYSAVDLMVVPSLQETLPQTASEAMACGTPVVAFGHTGLLDIVEHKKTGYLAKPFQEKDLATGIEWVLNSDNYRDLCFNAREKIVKEFDSSFIANRYIELYNKVTLSSKYDK